GWHPNPFTYRKLPIKLQILSLHGESCGSFDRQVRIEMRPKQSAFYPTILVAIVFDAEADQKSGLRADGDEASRRARAAGLLQRERCGRSLRHSAGGAGKDPAAAGEGRAAALATWKQRRLYAGTGP